MLDHAKEGVLLFSDEVAEWTVYELDPILGE